jgi:hypothetical protein
MIACKNEIMTPLYIIAMLLIASSVYQPCDADFSGSMDKGLLPSKFVKLERMRHKQQLFTRMEPATAELVGEGNRQEDLQPVKQTALFRASVKQMISDRLTRLFDSSKNTGHARQMAKDRISQHVKEMEDAQNQGYGHVHSSLVPESASKIANDMVNQYMKELRDAQDQKHLHEEKDANTLVRENPVIDDVYFYAGC